MNLPCKRLFASSPRFRENFARIDAWSLLTMASSSGNSHQFQQLISLADGLQSKRERGGQNPVVNHLSASSLATTLRQTRDAVKSINVNTEVASLCSDR
jgi:hypothetical protein